MSFVLHFSSYLTFFKTYYTPCKDLMMFRCKDCKRMKSTFRNPEEQLFKKSLVLWKQNIKKCGCVFFLLSIVLWQQYFLIEPKPKSNQNNFYFFVSQSVFLILFLLSSSVVVFHSSFFPAFHNCTNPIPLSLLYLDGSLLKGQVCQLNFSVRWAGRKLQL